MVPYHVIYFTRESNEENSFDFTSRRTAGWSNPGFQRTYWWHFKTNDISLGTESDWIRCEKSKAPNDLMIFLWGVSSHILYLDWSLGMTFLLDFLRIIWLIFLNVFHFNISNLFERDVFRNQSLALFTRKCDFVRLASGGAQNKYQNQYWAYHSSSRQEELLIFERFSSLSFSVFNLYGFQWLWINISSKPGSFTRFFEG